MLSPHRFCPYKTNVQARVPPTAPLSLPSSRQQKPGGGAQSLSTPQSDIVVSKTIHAPHRKFSVLMLTALLAGPALAQSPAPAAPFQLSLDGQMVIDTRAKLAWPRCAEGMSWSGKSCTGAADTFTYKQAQAYAVERGKADGQAWRLPRVNELKRLLDRNSKGLNPELFPNAPRDWHWTATAAVNSQRLNNYNYSQVNRSSDLSSLSAQQAWAVNTDTLQATPDMGKGNALLLRLVRPASAQELGQTQ